MGKPTRPGPCWMCNEPEIAYVDVLGLAWCPRCYKEIYLDEAHLPERGAD